MSAPVAAGTALPTGRRPLFGGYPLVAAAAAWVAGIALRPAGALGAFAPATWLALAVAGGALAVSAALLDRRALAAAARSARWPRLLFACGLLALF
ncbi:MAG: hypothetical protein ACHQ4H_12510, partial [Ktedonobacterales bacterium]